MTQAYSTSLEKRAWEPVDAHIKKKVVDGRNMTVTRYSFSPASVFPHHVHDQEQITYVLSGEVRFVLGGEDHRLRPGDLIVIPPDVPHSATAGTAGAELLSIVSPARTGGRGMQVVDEWDS
jgi:quercetin dioxygenase-like cupin family protein